VYLEKNVILQFKLYCEEKFVMGLSSGRGRVISCDWPFSPRNINVVGLMGIHNNLH
jgi:hypothetical protein